ncbi:hypothetical protein ACLM5J_19795 [Nocardioides sp. Bht2]|uniref:hypothetical protein n=1 Tax=Nocardioides sp. Bht2 TaxID=3392297 RepID=UPI0039B51F8F
MAGISSHQRAEYVKRGTAALRQLEADTSTTRRQLGAARDLVNRIYNHTNPATVGEALADLEHRAPRTAEAADTDR